MLFLGIDLGATNIAAALVDDGGLIIRQESVPTLAKRSAQEIIDDITGLALRLVFEEGLSERDITAVGIGIPGVVTPETGIVQLCPNLNWRQLPLKDLLQKQLSMPIHITNDANCAALAELYGGAFRGRQNAVLMTLGSGIGGGVIFGGRLHTGAHGTAGEIGHLVVELDGELCECGNRGCFERYASADALIRSMATDALTRSASADALTCSRAADTQNRTPSDIPLTAKDVIDAAKDGNAAATSAFEKYVYNLAKGIVSIINLYDPEVVALGGGVSHAGDFLLQAVRDEVAEHQFIKGYPVAEIVLATLGNEAGLVGAALYARQKET